ncbi:Nramp family divalent metal transporter [Sphingomonas oryzagri]|uniref:Divalent metal cation transporter MntH n=1 Tax=Sphingomonas oryzagri TaxID=3042314 RepID=A0ABT6N296_9SPHN|nr:Nramp family divalent metal transporter [Sphingomonas oryzagri]MDH7638899.1 Nramp family divalent metal transporter [Sphingomonas oryzagri]
MASVLGLKLPETATAPFCPSEVEGSIAVPRGAPLGTRLARFVGPGLLVAVGYMDPGNWATDIAAGSGYGFDLLFVVVAASLAAILLQSLALRLGMASGLDLAQACRRRYGRLPNLALWMMAEIAILATDVAEVLGGALAIKLLLGLPLWAGILLTAFDMLLVVGLKGRGFRQVEAIVGALVATIALCFLIELIIVPPDGHALAAGLVPDLGRLSQPGALAVAIGIVGATVMPHNLYLHSSIVQTRRVDGGRDGLRKAIRIANLDSAVSLLLAMLVNAAILTLAAGAFHANGHHGVTGIDEAYRLLSPITGAKAAALFFGIALFASGQSSTFTGTIAGQVVLEGFLKLKIPCWQRRVITRTIAIIPALAGVLWFGDGGVGPMLVLSQILLSLQLPFAIWPLIRSASDRGIMGELAAGAPAVAGAWALFAIISAANLWLIVSLFT